MTDTTAWDDKLTCPVCQEIFSDAIETACGHAFCEYCLNKALERKPNICPVCIKNPSPAHPSYTLRALCDSINKPKGNEDKTAAKEKELGNDCYGKSLYADAISHYSEALALSKHKDSELAILHSNRAQCYIKLDQFQRALDDVNEAIRINSSDVKAYIRKGLCHCKIGDYGSSRDAYHKALSLDTAGKFQPAIMEALASLQSCGVDVSGLTRSTANTNSTTTQQQQQQQQAQHQYYYPPQQHPPPPPGFMPYYPNNGFYPQQGQGYQSYPPPPPAQGFSQGYYTAPTYPPAGPPPPRGAPGYPGNVNSTVNTSTTINTNTNTNNNGTHTSASSSSSSSSSDRRSRRAKDNSCKMQ